MIIKIVRCSNDNFWYRDRIDELFEVEIYYHPVAGLKNVYVVKKNGFFTNRLVTINDTEIIEDMTEWKKIPYTGKKDSNGNYVLIEAPGEGKVIELKGGNVHNLLYRIVDVEKEQVKDWDWYKEEYIDKKDYSLTFDYDYNGSCKTLPFVFRMGLFRFICNDLDLDWLSTLSLIKTYIFTPNEHFGDIEKISDEKIGAVLDRPKILEIHRVCPKEFLESLLNDN